MHRNCFHSSAVLKLLCPHSFIIITATDRSEVRYSDTKCVLVGEHFQGFGFGLDFTLSWKQEQNTPYTQECPAIFSWSVKTAAAHCHVFIGYLPSLTQVLNYPQSDVHKAIRLSIHLGERVIVPWVPQQTKQHTSEH